MFHSCPSYGCLQSLESTPTSTSGMTLKSQAREIRPPAYEGPSLDDAQFRSNSPLTVAFDDETDHAFEDIDMSSSWDEQLAWLQIPLKGGCCMDDSSRHHQHQQQQSRKKRRVHFLPSVEVTLIPSHRDYSDATKQQLWASTEEIRINAVKAQMEMCLYEHVYPDESESGHDDDFLQEPEHQFVPLQRMQKAR
ncbi:expressed unknown protein [Seminavis robusta]|uniref:Uncharacterized protein n=1 Tax=Seminavis robusta TaxID=568900 RepID=A0A9N8EIB5_9STRA|nr:expressed unknown protein [Seminavis robusta]|eukprot:Sro980_g227470.1 n/a (193) ;mRNA; f:37938-38516